MATIRRVLNRFRSVVLPSVRKNPLLVFLLAGVIFGSGVYFSIEATRASNERALELANTLAEAGEARVQSKLFRPFEQLKIVGEMLGANADSAAIEDAMKSRLEQDSSISVVGVSWHYEGSRVLNRFMRIDGEVRGIQPLITRRGSFSRQLDTILLKRRPMISAPYQGKLDTSDTTGIVFTILYPLLDSNKAVRAILEMDIPVERLTEGLDSNVWVMAYDQTFDSYLAVNREKNKTEFSDTLSVVLNSLPFPKEFSDSIIVKSKRNTKTPYQAEFGSTIYLYRELGSPPESLGDANWGFVAQMDQMRDWSLYILGIAFLGTIFLILIFFLAEKEYQRQVKVNDQIARAVLENNTVKAINRSLYEVLNKGNLMDAHILMVAVVNTENPLLLDFPNNFERGAKEPIKDARMTEPQTMDMRLPENRHRPATLCLESKKPLIENDMGKKRGQFPELEKPTFGELIPESLIYVPLFGEEDRLIGVLSVQSPNRNAYTKEHVELLTKIGTICGLAIDKVQNLEAKKKALAEKEEASKAKDIALAKLEEASNAKDDALAAYKRALEDKDKALVAMNSALEEKEAAFSEKNKALLEIDQLVRHKDKIYYAIGHELTTLAFPIRSGLDLMRDTGKYDKESLDLLFEQAERNMEFSEMILNWLRAGKAIPGKISLSSEVAQVVETLRKLGSPPKSSRNNKYTIIDNQLFMNINFVAFP